MFETFDSAKAVVDEINSDFTWTYDAEDGDLRAMLDALRQLRDVIDEELSARAVTEEGEEGESR